MTNGHNQVHIPSEIQGLRVSEFTNPRLNYYSPFVNSVTLPSPPTWNTERITWVDKLGIGLKQPCNVEPDTAGVGVKVALAHDGLRAQAIAIACRP